MKNRKKSFWNVVPTLMTLMFALGAVSCSTAGGKQEIALDHQSVGRDLKGNVDKIDRHTQDVFKEMGISLTGTQTKEAGKEHDLNGSNADKSVTVQLSQLDNGMTHVEVTAKSGTLQWSQDYANVVLSKIIEKS